MWTGLTDSPGVIVKLGEPGMIGMPGVVTVPGLPDVVGGTEHLVPGTGSRYRGTGYQVPDRVPGPGVTGAYSEYTGRSTGDC